MNGLVVTAKMAGIESTANARSVVSTIINTTASIRDAAIIMTRGHFRHLPVTSNSGLVGMVDITDICRALIGLAPLEEKET